MKRSFGECLTEDEVVLRLQTEEKEKQKMKAEIKEKKQLAQRKKEQLQKNREVAKKEKKKKRKKALAQKRKIEQNKIKATANKNKQGTEVTSQRSPVSPQAASSGTAESAGSSEYMITANYQDLESMWHLYIYDEDLYIGEDATVPITPNHVTIKYMHPHGTNRFSWPERKDDILQTRRCDILCKLQSIIPTTACHWRLNQEDLAKAMVKFNGR